MFMRARIREYRLDYSDGITTICKKMPLVCLITAVTKQFDFWEGRD